MVTRGKNINLFLMDGDPSGRIKCTLANWTGVAYRIPRTELDRCKEREDLSQSGVYFLFGTSDQTGDDVVYIGQAGVRKNGEGILYRLLEHRRNPDKDYWTEAVVFTTSNNSFGPTEISYLENRFTKLAKDANRYTITNGNEPPLGNITEEKESELEEFVDYAKIIMGTLGHKIFEPLLLDKQNIDGAIEKDTSVISERELYLKRGDLKSGQKIDAKCKQTSEGFVLLKGSHIRLENLKGIPPAVKSRREEMISNNKIDKNGVLLEDILFKKSPSYVAAFVIGSSANGLVEWKNADGRTLKSLEDEEEK